MGECSICGIEWGRYVIYNKDTDEEIRFCVSCFKKLPKELREKAIDLGKIVYEVK